MRRSLVLLLLLSSAALVLANNTGKSTELQVVLADGRSARGKVKLRKTKLEVRGLGKVAYGEVAELRELLPLAEGALAEALAELEKRRGKLAEDDAPGWARLGRWAGERGLVEEARAAFEAAVAADPDHADARRGLGQMRVDGGWVPTAQEISRRRKEVARDDVKGLLALAEDAADNGAPSYAFRLFFDALAQDPSNKRGLKELRPVTDRRVHTTRLTMPVQGLWKASEDKTRHHQLNASSVYALDLVRVDEEGRHFSGKGKDREQHFAWGEPFFAAAPGRVFWVENDFPDLPAGRLGRRDRNNGVGVQHENDEFTWYFHAQRGSITVKKGDQVERGQELGRVGNSGKSNIPHLHFALAYRGFLGLPWRVDELTLVAKDGTRIPCKGISPREGWTFEASRPAPPEGN